MSHCLQYLLPYGEGGCCAPRWYDVHIEGMYLTREDVSRYVPFASDTIAGPIILDSNNLEFDDEGGLRFTGALHVFNQYNLEFTYFGLFNWSSTAQVTDTVAPFDIYTAFSDFGVNPFNGFDETDRADFVTAQYSSAFDNFELNVRKRWTGANCRLQGSTLMGARYFWLDEDFSLLTQGNVAVNNNANAGNMDYRVNTSNAMTGFQVGGDLWTCIVPGISVGADMKLAVMGNHVDQDTSIFASTTALGAANTYVETRQDNSLAGLAEANLMSIWRVNPHWTIRGGYNFLYLDGVALAIENFNPEPPNTFANVGGRVRTPRLNDNGDLFLHGFTLGFEYMW